MIYERLFDYRWIRSVLDRRVVVKISIRDLNLFYGTFHALKDISLSIYDRRVTALIGPSGCGKSTLLRVLNRMNDIVPGCRVSGRILLDGEDIYAKMDVAHLRARVGMVFQNSTPLPMSIFENVAYGPRIHGIARDKTQLEEIVITSLERAGLLGAVKDRMHERGTGLSSGQQQQLCIARAIAIGPSVVLLDNPCSALDPHSTEKVEELIDELKSEYCIVIVTNNMQQATRVSDFTAFMFLGELIEFGTTEQLFTMPSSKWTQDYITGRLG